MRVALALGSGGARGYAHIGAIRELEARGHEVVHYTGASMGAVVGSLAAAGRLDEFETWVRTLSQRDVLRLLDVTFAGGGAIRGNKIMSVIGEMLDGARIEDLAVPFTAVATDLRARREVWFTRGPVDVALRASFAIPSVISPAVVAGRLMVDGGVTNPVPMEPLASVSADMVMAVSLTGRRAGMRESTMHESSDGGAGAASEDAPDGPVTDGPAPVAEGTAPGAEPRLGRLGRGTRSAQAGATRARAAVAGRLRSAAADARDTELLRAIVTRLGQNADELGIGREDGPDAARGEASEEVTRAAEEGASEDLGSLPRSLGMFEVVAQSLDAMESLITAYRMAGNHPDVLVEVPTDACSTFDFHRAEEIIALGRGLTAEALDRNGL